MTPLVTVNVRNSMRGVSGIVPVIVQIDGLLQDVLGSQLSKLWMSLSEKSRFLKRFTYSVPNAVMTVVVVKLTVTVDHFTVLTSTNSTRYKFTHSGVSVTMRSEITEVCKRRSVYLFAVFMLTCTECFRRRHGQKMRLTAKIGVITMALDDKV